MLDALAPAFAAWAARYGYAWADAAEHAQRLRAFSDNAAFVESTNAQALPYTLALNKFAHLTFDEFKATKMRYAPLSSTVAVRGGVAGGTSSPLTGPLASPTPPAGPPPPASLDWESRGAVTRVRDEHPCDGACWAFSAAGALEGAYFVAHGGRGAPLLELSTMQLVSCVANTSCLAGGEMQQAFEYVKANGGLCSEQDYPYAPAPNNTMSPCRAKGASASAVGSSTGGGAGAASCRSVPGTALSGFAAVSQTEAALKQVAADPRPAPRLSPQPARPRARARRLCSASHSARLPQCTPHPTS